LQAAVQRPGRDFQTQGVELAHRPLEGSDLNLMYFRRGI
jgi:hypothetical protein